MTLVYIHTQAADQLRALANRTELLGFIGRLEANPTDTHGDYSQPDPRGRAIEVKIIGLQAILFFKDPFANLVKILDIRHVEAL